MFGTGVPLKVSLGSDRRHVSPTMNDRSGALVGISLPAAWFGKRCVSH